MVFGSNPAIAEHFDLLKAERATSLAQQDLQGSAQAQKDAATDAMLGRFPQQKLADEYKAQRAGLTPAQRAEVDAANRITPTHLRPGYEQQKQAVTALAQRMLEEQQAVLEEQEAEEGARIIGLGGPTMDPGEEWVGVPGEATDPQEDIDAREAARIIGSGVDLEGRPIQ